MPSPQVTVVVPTLAADDALADCLRSLQSQTFDRFEVIVVDNSGAGRVKETTGVRVITNATNVGFGAAVNQGFRASPAPYVVTLNDDAVAHPQWLEALVAAADSHPEAGMVASQVRMAGTETLDSTGMLIATDGSSKQRGHGQPVAGIREDEGTLFPAGSAALYRRKMLEEIGLFDEDFFLYCEDSDLGLRARWAGWGCVYAPEAVVEHRYSHSAGRSSPLKAYYVERNRLYLILKNYPFSMLFCAFFASFARYFWHILSLFEQRGKAAEFRDAGHPVLLLPFLVLRAHFVALVRLPRLFAERRRIRETRKISGREFRRLLARHSISVREVAAL